MKLGIDFGTTNSSVAMYDGDELHRLHLDAGNDNPYILPSLIYLDRDQNARVGTAAATAYLESETGRPVSWERRRVGEIDVYASDMHYVQDVNVMVDVAQGVSCSMSRPVCATLFITARRSSIAITVDELVRLSCGI
jgi:hypothetical chaperone protein